MTSKAVNSLNGRDGIFLADMANLGQPWSGTWLDCFGTEVRSPSHPGSRQVRDLV